MGQAKNRGTFDDRLVAAKARINAIRPKKIICNDCKAEITEIADLDTRGVVGIRGAFAGKCPECNRITLAVDGEPDRAAELLLAFEETMGGGNGLLGAQTRDGQKIDGQN